MILDVLPGLVSWLPEEREFFHRLARREAGPLPFPSFAWGEDPKADLEDLVLEPDDLRLVEDVLEDLRLVVADRAILWEPREVVIQNGIETPWARGGPRIAAVAFLVSGHVQGPAYAWRDVLGRERAFEPHDGDVALVDLRGEFRWVAPLEGSAGFRGAVIVR